MTRATWRARPTWSARVAASSVSIDLHKKLNAYRRNGVREYLVWRVVDKTVDWFVLEQDEYRSLSLDEGFLKSTIFPGLWLDPQALIERDFSRLCAALDRGMATDAYQAFRQKVAEAFGRTSRRNVSAIDWNSGSQKIPAPNSPRGGLCLGGSSPESLAGCR